MRLTQISEKGPTTVKTTGRWGLATVTARVATSVTQHEKPTDVTPKSVKLPTPPPLDPEKQDPKGARGAKTRPLMSSK